MNNIYIKSFFLLFVIYISITIIIYFYQRKLLYHPDFNSNLNKNGLTSKFETIKFKTYDNFQLKGWFHLKNLRKKTILFLHGNAGNLENRIEKLNALAKLDINILIIAWRGYSLNPGKPSEIGLYNDADGAIKWLISQGIFEKNIILYGESLGTAVAIHSGQFKNFAGIILEAPFTSMVDMGKKYYPIFPVKLLLKDKYLSKRKIKNLISPLLIMHGRKDNIVPFYMGEEIFNLAKDPKYKYFTDYDNHMMDFNKDLINSINQFIKSLN